MGAPGLGNFSQKAEPGRAHPPTDDGFDMDVSSCVYARFFQELGETDLGFMLVCSADFDMVEEMPDLELNRTQTIMQGADHCDFRYRFLNQT